MKINERVSLLVMLEKSRLTTDGKAPIFIRLTVDGKRAEMSLGQKVHAYLKEVADICGINKNLTTHTARHTFATTVTLANGVPIETVSAMLGHKSIKTTQIYAKIVAQKISTDMSDLKKKLMIKMPNLQKLNELVA
ncbi:tyrosine-type recombinase/integrase [Mucilaginibacter sp. AW1-7]|uniref:tyrosine-type recombinase/integrase n=1 Tax=Mucilaginibacter sp. AW1-7 TaxID=3349874 RepID=UPI003F7361D1